MKKKLLVLLIITLTVTTIFLTGCGEEVESGEGPIKIGGITSLSGALQDYGEQMQRGFELGLEYATDGTMEIEGRPIEVLWEDTATEPEVARERALILLEEENVDILVGPASSADAGAMLSLAEEFETLLMIEPAAAESLTGADWNRYVFRTGRNSAQDARAMAEIITNANPNAKVATLAPDSAFGQSMVAPFAEALEEMGGELVVQEFPPAETTDFSSYILRIREEAPDFAYVIWAGANNPWGELMEHNLEDYGIEITTGAPEMAALRMMQPLVGMTGFTVYYHSVPDNEVNDWLVDRHQEEYDMAPDIFTSGGMASAIAIVRAIEENGGSTDTDELIETMRGMEFESPTGTRYFRSEDHQAIQPLFEIELTEVDGEDHPVPVHRRTIDGEDIAPPIRVPDGAPR